MDQNSQKASYTLTTVPGRNIVKAYPIGVWTAADVNKYVEDIMKIVSKFNGKWAFMPDISKMAPIVDIEASNALTVLHKKFEDAKCVAMAFIVGGAVAIKAQAQRHQDKSNVEKLVVNHLRNEEAALEWLKSVGI